MRNEKGLTLIELLASLSLLLIVSSLMYGVLIGVNKSNAKTADKNKLEQEANIILLTIKNYQLGDMPYKIKYDAGTGSYSIESAAKRNLIAKGNIILFRIDGTEINKNQPEKNIDPRQKKAITLYIKIQSDVGEAMIIDTSIKRY